ncbi:MAG: 4-(cytidine 5'-diphospho)-2-C-methyl-D-erythritol kinase [Acidimicrobiales bacterium]
MVHSLVHLFAPAKLTTALRVTGVREDGYHLIDAEMVSLDFGDRLIVESAEQISVVFVDPSGLTIDLGPDDLVSRAMAMVGRKGRIRVEKSIAAGAGLGGGSADAAAILHWAGVTDPEIAVLLGADVAFCLRGGRAQVGGIGERVESLPFESRYFTLLTPPVMCSTPAVYRAWDDLGGPRGENGNDLEPAALVVAPELAAWRDVFADQTGCQPRLAGSGSTWFVEGEFPGEGRVVARTSPAR